MIQVIAFDLDGLLIDSEPIWNTVKSEIYEKHGLSWSYQDQKNTTGKSTLSVAEYLSSRLGNNISPEDMEIQIVNKMVEYFDKHIPLLPGSNEIINMLSGYDLAIVSGSPRLLISKVLQKMEWTTRFSLILSDDNVANGKPAPDLYNLVCEYFEINPEKLLVFEDSSNGILSAYNAKARVVAVPTRYTSISGEVLSKASIVLNSLEEFSCDLLLSF